MIQIKNIFTGKVIKEVDADTLSRANLRWADLSEADLRGADLSRANLSRAKTSFCIVHFSPDEIEQAKQFVEGLER